MNWPRIRHNLFWVGLILGVSFLVYQFFISAPTLKNIQWDLNAIGLISGCVLLMGITVFLQIVNYSLILKLFGINIGFSKVVSGYVMSMLPKYVPGGVWGYLSRGVWMEKNFNVQYQVTTACTLLEILIIVDTALITGVSGLALTISINLQGLALIIIILIFFASWGLVNFLWKILKPKYLTADVSFGLPLGKWLKLSCIGLLQWVVLGGATILSIQLITANQILQLWTWTNYVYATIGFAISWLIGFLIVFVPGGVGVREMILSIMLIYFFHVSLEVATAIGISTRLFYTSAEAIWLVIGRFVRLRNPNNSSLIQ